MKSSYLVSGLMSGTSMDGVDLALCAFDYANSNWTYEIVEAITIPYARKLEIELSNAIHLSNDRIKELDIELAIFYADILNQFHKKHGTIPEIISSHGHTIFHEPEKGYTLQIGNGMEMANRTGITVVNNFRMKDLEYGGQGAPLVPVGDHLLFGNYDICLNIGGISNLSFEKSGKRLAYDICPANLVLNHLAEKINLPFDKDGYIAASGQISSKLLSSLNELAYYSEKPPKTLGREWVEHVVFPLLTKSGLPVSDLISTVTEHIAIQIGNSIREIGGKSILATGGGAMNCFLIDRIRKISGNDIQLPEKKLIDYKESLIFGLLGVLRLRDETNCYASVTGASRDLSTGDIYPG